LETLIIPLQGDGDDTAMNGVKFYCPATGAWIYSIAGPWGSWTHPLVRS